MRWTFVNDAYYEEEKAVLKTGDLALQRGYAVFDYFRTSDSQPLFPDDYLDRFFNSASRLFITIPQTREQIKNAIDSLIEKNQIAGDSGIRMLATGGYSPDSYTPVRGNLIIQQHPVALPGKEKFEQGMKIVTHEYMRDFPEVKSINYLMGIWLQQQLKEKEADDVVYFRNNIISEFPRANIFIVTRDGKLATPAQHILHGITRKKVLQLAHEMLPVEKRDISVNELKNAAEVFMTSTTKRLLPVIAIDGNPVGNGKPGKVTRQLYEQFMAMELQYLHAAK
ncbi:amino acid aminotransferase [Niabella ginsenosidivorans]|uniref:branched-chain-amino-acid transaminase n=1 Tax=Niabella ginsenosidivorans TaxID=1176587 RepID=A0A1A9HWJ0_9BACT|nr:aminotransferase class IV [Niabella ginsenosidivorans]ANH79603.1 amino acid aminotransferase [Niabella ginsenosidivorans]